MFETTIVDQLLDDKQTNVRNETRYVRSDVIDPFSWNDEDEDSFVARGAVVTRETERCAFGCELSTAAA